MTAKTAPGKFNDHIQAATKSYGNCLSKKMIDPYLKDDTGATSDKNHRLATRDIWTAAELRVDEINASKIPNQGRSDNGAEDFMGRGRGTLFESVLILMFDESA